jgi:phosphate transport system substrate-binding protein
VNEVNVAMDAISIIVNPTNALNEISLAQLKSIYIGQVKNWKELGGEDRKITLLSRETSSGTYVFFLEHVLQKQDPSPSAMMMPATSAIIESAASDKGAVGYVGLGYAVHAKERVKILRVKRDESSPGVEPSEENAVSGTYPIARYLHCYTNGKPAGAIKAFLDFCLSPKGQAVVREQGFVPLPK